MSKFRQFWIYPFKTTKMLFTYLEPNELKKYAPENFDEVHVVEIAALEAAQKEIERLKYENEVYVSLTEPRIEQLAAALKVAEGALKRLSQSGDGIHSDKKASFYDCLPTLQIEFSERKELAKETLAEIQKIKKGKI